MTHSRSRTRLVLLLSLVFPACMDSRPESTEESAQALFNAAGSTTTPSTDDSVTAVGRIELEHATCTGTLIHPKVVLTNSCVKYPSPGFGAKVFFRKTDGTELSYGIESIAMVPEHSFANQSVNGAVITTDLALIKLKEAANSAFKPLDLAEVYPSNGTQVTSYGYGAYGKTDCSKAYDGKKRKITWQWGAPPYRSCDEDGGAPVLIDASGTPQIVATITNASSLGNVLYHREYIYEQVRLMLNGFPAPDGDVNSHVVEGITRDGPKLGGARTANSATACQDLCLTNSACKAWTFTGTSCQLKAFPGRWTLASGTSSGLRPLLDIGKTMTGGTTVGDSAETNTAFSCAARCADYSGCVGWTYKPAASGNPSSCKMLSALGERSTSSKASSGIRPSAATIDVDLPGGTYLTVPGLLTEMNCASRCAKDGECVAYTFTAAKSCQLKNVIPNVSAKAGYRSNFKRAMVGPGHLLYGRTTIVDWDTLTPPVPEQCRARCEADDTCAAYTYIRPFFGAEGFCSLFAKQTTGPTVLFKADSGAGADSGYKSLLWH